MTFESIKYTIEIELEEVPIQWIASIELFSPSIPQLPTMYVHLHNNGDRIYGFPAYFYLKSVNKEKKNCILVFNFVSNKDLANNEILKRIIKEELENRIGLSDKVGIADLLKACKGNRDYENFINSLWVNYASIVCGEYIPFGRFYDQTYSIMRFIAALAPLSGGKSEEQMVYDFMSHYGESISIENEWGHFEFYLIPTYEEILNKTDISEFKKFKSMYDSVTKFGELFFTRTETSGNITLKLLDKGVPNTSSNFRALTESLISQGKLNQIDKENIDFLVDAFNRMPMRAAAYIGAIINITEEGDYRKWNKQEFLDFYVNKNTTGFSMKCAGCFLQQGFGNREVIPIDTWVESFFNEAMDIDSKQDIITKFDDIGRLERLIWLIAQARKKNMRLFYNVLWCIRYGVKDTKILRGPNPISCFECKLRDNCIGYAKIEGKTVFIQQGNTLPTGHNDCLFTVGIQNQVPKFVFKNLGSWGLIDEYSGVILHKNTTNFVNQVKTVKELIQDLQQ